jgi:hypothetical protein
MTNHYVCRENPLKKWIMSERNRSCMIINFMINDLIINFIKLAFLIYKLKDLINESSAVVYQLEDWISILGNRNFNIACTLN